jgi:hypothetical protein
MAGDFTVRGGPDPVSLEELRREQEDLQRLFDE